MNKDGYMNINNNLPQFIPPNYETAFNLLYGFCLGKGLREELEKIPEIGNLLRPSLIVREE